MSSILDKVRTAIKEAKARTPEERNHIYLAAQKAIQRLPEDQAEFAMAQLQDAVKSIEEKFAQHELKTAALDDTANNERQDGLDTSILETTASYDEKPGQRSETTSSGTWRLLLIILGLILAMIFSAYLVYTEFGELNPSVSRYGTYEIAEHPT